MMLFLAVTDIAQKYWTEGNSLNCHTQYRETKSFDCRLNTYEIYCSIISWLVCTIQQWKLLRMFLEAFSRG